MNQSWTFLSNHTHVLVSLSRDPTLTLREVASQVGLTERAVQRIVRELEEEKVLSHTREGRRNVYKIHRRMRLRHPLEAHRTIGDLLTLVMSE